MDAVKRAWRVFHGLIFQRWVPGGLLALFYIPMWFVPPYYHNAPAGLLMAAVPAGGMGLLATERIIRYCASAAELSVPRHTPSVRAAQLLVIVIFSIAPGVLCLVRGAPVLPVTAVLLGALSFGTLLVMNPAFFVLFLFSVVTAKGQSFLGTWLVLPAVQWVVVALSLYQLARWLRLPRSDGPLRWRNVVFADASHERRVISSTAEAEADPAEQVIQERLELLDGPEPPGPDDEQLSIALRGVTSDGISAEALGVGFGFVVIRSWRPLLNAVAVGIACLAVAHFWGTGQYQHLVYLLITVVAAVAVASGVSGLSNAWSRTPVEQSLLLLTPRWPASKVVKLSMNTAMFRAQMGGWVGWSAVVLVCGALGWIEPGDILFGMFVLFAAMCSTFGIAWWLFALSYVPETNWTGVVVLLLAVIGVACHWAGAVVLGFVFVVGPAALALLAMLLRPLQFPVERRT